MQELQSGILLMVIGMGTVFVFLAIMVCAIKISARVSAPFAHLIPEPTPKGKPKKKPAAAAADDATLLTVISAAVHQYRQDHN